MNLCKFYYRYGETVTSTYTPSCFLVAVDNTAATTALNDVDECYANTEKKRKKRSIVDDKPFDSSLNNIIMPSR